MIGMLFVRAMEMMNSRHGFYDDEPKVCERCGREGCTCGPDCDCGKEGSFDKTLPPQEELVQDFE